MSSTAVDFGATEPVADEHANGNGADAHASDAIDLNDPRLQSESIEVDPQADAYAVAPVPPDGVYRAKLKSTGGKDKDGKPAQYTAKLDAKSGKLYAAIGVEAKIIGIAGHEKYDGIVINDPFVDTHIWGTRNPTSRVATLLGKLGVQVPSQDTVGGWIQRLIKALSAEPEAGIETVWEASCENCQKKAKAEGNKYRNAAYGMHRFPTKAGVADPAVQCPECKAWLRARARIQRYLSIEELKLHEGKRSVIAAGAR